METKDTDITNHEDIAELAYKLWDKGGRQEGHDLEYWLKAEKQAHAQVETKRQTAPQRTSNR